MRLKLILLVLVGVFLSYAVASPYITAYRIGSALQNNDAAALSQHIDFPAIRQSLKDELNAAMTEKAAQEAETNPFASLGALLAGAIADKFIDAIVTPAGLRRLLKEGRLDPSMSVENQSNEDDGYSLPKASMSYESLDSFVVVMGDDDDTDNPKLVLKRSGLSWKLSEIRL